MPGAGVSELTGLSTTVSLGGATVAPGGSTTAGAGGTGRALRCGRSRSFRMGGNRRRWHSCWCDRCDHRLDRRSRQQNRGNRFRRRGWFGSKWDGRHRRNGLRSYARRWRDRTSNAWRCRAAGERHTPEAEGRLSELQFDVSARAARRLGFHHLADNFLLRFLVRQKN